MLKILYAAGNAKNSKIQLTRFMQAIQNKTFIIKIAAFKISSPSNINIDWTLDCLIDMFNKDYITSDNDNLRTYYEQVKYFKPDVIISDMEQFTSQIANQLNITLWQCSSSLINFALNHKQKYNLGLFNKYSYIFNKNPRHFQRMINCIDNSNCNFVYSHLGDTLDAPILNSKFEWIRPYHKIGKISIPCQHNMVAAMLRNNKKILDLLKKYPDSVSFTEFYSETYSNLLMKDISNEEEYFCNLINCKLFVCEGQTSFLADAFYNGRYTAVLTNLTDPECIINSTIAEKQNLCTIIHQTTQDLNPLMDLSVECAINPDIKYLHERLEQL